jgi:hypothetical protein
MQPVKLLFRHLVLILVSMLVGWLVRREVLSFDDGEILRPLIIDAIIQNLPLLLPGVTSFVYQVYEKFILHRLFGTARQMPASATEREVMNEALGDGGKRTAAKVLLGVK